MSLGPFLPGLSNPTSAPLSNVSTGWGSGLSAELPACSWIASRIRCSLRASNGRFPVRFLFWSGVVSAFQALITLTPLALSSASSHAPPQQLWQQSLGARLVHRTPRVQRPPNLPFG